MNARERFFKRGAGNGGFSLVEVLIAMSILSVGLLAMAQMQVAALKQNEVTRRRAAVMTVAQEYMDRVINVDYADVPSLEGTETITREITSGASPKTVTCEVKVDALVEGTPSAHTRIVEVTVNWNEGTMPKTFLMRTVKSEAEDLQV